MATHRRPQDLVFTLYGEYLLGRDAPTPVGGLIALLQPFGLTQGAVRTVLSRMARKGWLEAHRAGRNAFYDLTERGRRLLEEGQAKIFHPSWDVPWDGRWFLLAYSIPEDERQLRDRLRDRLAWLGFGSLGNGIWISPHDVTRQVDELASQLHIERHLECFRAVRVGGSPVEELVSKCWDLNAVNRHYRVFIERWQPVLAATGEDLASGRVRAEEFFALRFDLIHEFRAFPLEDPYLPRALLPHDWWGEPASELFHTLHDRVVGPADEYVDAVLRAAPTLPPLAGRTERQSPPGAA